MMRPAVIFSRLDLERMARGELLQFTVAGTLVDAYTDEPKRQLQRADDGDSVRAPRRHARPEKIAEARRMLKLLPPPIKYRDGRRIFGEAYCARVLAMLIREDFIPAEIYKGGGPDPGTLRRIVTRTANGTAAVQRALPPHVGATQ